jgi:hypothetical protein
VSFFLCLEGQNLTETGAPDGPGGGRHRVWQAFLTGQISTWTPMPWSLAHRR